MNYKKEDIIAKVKEENIKYIRLQFTDMLGMLKNVEVPVTRLDDVLENNVMFDGSSIEGFVRIQEADMYLYPDLNTFLVLEWEETTYGKVARLICDVYTSKRVPFVGDPRGILKRNIEKMRQMGFFKFNCGVEPEFYLFKLDEKGNPTLNPSDAGGYFDLSPIDTAEDCRRDIALQLQKLGFVIEASHHEVGPGQQEINFRFDNAVEACDNIQTFKLVVKNVARRHGLHATFMPKPISNIAGSGMHVNCSLADMDGKNVFYDSESKNGLSEIANRWISGLIHHADGLSLFCNPTVNSYKRIVPGYEAPCYVSWSDANRSTMIRIPAARGNKTRTELRSVDPSANPYLAIACILAAGLDGVAGNVELVEPVYANLFAIKEKEREALGVRSLPENLSQAIKAFEKDKYLQDAVGDHISKKMIMAKSLEWDEYRKFVTEWEITHYLKRY